MIGSRWCPAVLLVAAAGCEPNFALPEGDAARGRETFRALECHACHSADGIERLENGADGIDVPLGGRVNRRKSYAELVTSIINPSHRIAPTTRTLDVARIAEGELESRMRSYNDVMTVQQLTDLVTWLAPQYEVVPPPWEYPDYPLR